VTEPLEPEVRFGRENERLKLSNADLRSINRKLLRRGGGFAVDDAIQEFRDVLSSGHDFGGMLQPLHYAAPKTIALPQKQDLVIGAGWSDWHLAERVRKQETNGFNEYNSVIAANRVWQVVDQTKQRVTNLTVAYNPKELWLLCLGDMINGSIHPDLAYTNDLTDPAAVILCSRLMEMGINELKTLGLPIHINCVVGNHPRTTVKMPTKRQGHQSLDWVIYEIVANHFRKDDQVTLEVETGQIGMRDVMGHRYLFEHGIDVKSGAEEDFESRLRSLYDDSIYRKATGSKGSTFDQVVIGNMHKPKFLERTIVAGSLVGQTELGVSWRLKPVRAEQALWGITPTCVRDWMHPVICTDITSQKAINPFSEFAVWFVRKHGRQ
jgi:hypothetical protein